MAKIMLLENSALDRMQIVSALEQEGHTIIEVTDGREVEDRIREDDPDCIVMELVVVGIDGFKIIRTLREHGIKTPIIVQTSMGKESMQKMCMELGADAFIRKPVNVMALSKTILKVLDGA